MKRGLKVEHQKPIPIVYNGVHFGAGFRCDLLINDKVIVEVKSLEKDTASKVQEVAAGDMVPW